MSVSIIVSDQDPYGDNNVERNFWATSAKKSQQMNSMWYHPKGCYPRGKVYWNVVKRNCDFHEENDSGW